MSSSSSEVAAVIDRANGAWTIVNASTAQALQWNSAEATITLATPTTDDNQKWVFPVATDTTSYIYPYTNTNYRLVFVVGDYSGNYSFKMSTTLTSSWTFTPTTSTDGRSAFNLNTDGYYLTISKKGNLSYSNASSVTDASNWIVTKVSS
jgi:hypothetical protein